MEHCFDAEMKDEKSQIIRKYSTKDVAGWKTYSKFDKPMLQMRMSEGDKQEPKQEHRKGNKQII